MASKCLANMAATLPSPTITAIVERVLPTLKDVDTPVHARQVIAHI